jgi:protein phosphatase
MAILAVVVSVGLFARKRPGPQRAPAPPARSQPEQAGNPTRRERPLKTGAAREPTQKAAAAGEAAEGQRTQRTQRGEQEGKAAAPEETPPPPGYPVGLPKLHEDEDDVEVTLVAASPASLLPAKLGDSAPPRARQSEHPSRVEVTYEDEAEVEEVTLPTARILVTAEGQSDGGRIRKRNEDNYLILRERSLFVVADGMGGYAGGDVASRIAVDTVGHAFVTDTFEGKTESSVELPRRGREMACAVQMANQAILTRSETQADLAGMGTTLVAVRFSPNKQRAYIGHVGDSRCYRIRGDGMKQLTTDHTLLGLGLKGPGSQHLYQALGIKRRINIDVIVDKPRADDIYLLCSDGLSKMVTDDQIRDIIVGEPDLEAAVYGLIEAANDRGGKDNITVILVKVLEKPSSFAKLAAARPPEG